MGRLNLGCGRSRHEEPLEAVLSNAEYYWLYRQDPGGGMPFLGASGTEAEPAGIQLVSIKTSLQARKRFRVVLLENNIGSDGLKGKTCSRCRPSPCTPNRPRILARKIAAWIAACRYVCGSSHFATAPSMKLLATPPDGVRDWPLLQFADVATRNLYELCPGP